MNRIAGRNIYIVKLANVVRASGGIDGFVARCARSKFRSIWIRLDTGRGSIPTFRSLISPRSKAS